MNIFNSPKFPDWESYFPAVDGVGIVSIPSKITAAAFLALDSLTNCVESIGRHLIQRASPLPENELLKLCISAINQTSGTEEIIIQARNLIKEGAEIHSSFKNAPGQLAWLREHCAEELRERAAVTMKGLELIDFETILPPNWQPPEWLSPPQKLEVSEEQIAKSKHGQLAQEIGLGSIIAASFCLSMIALAYSNRFPLDNILPPAALAALPLAIGATAFLHIMTAPLNQNDMQRLHAKAMQNPLYESLWKKVEDTSQVIIELAPLSMFLSRGSSRANFSPDENKIKIYERLSEQGAFEALIFESANAYQKGRFAEIILQWEQGRLSKEEYARLLEYVEWKTSGIYYQIMDFGKKECGWPQNLNMCSPEMASSFNKSWESTNMRSSLDKADSHTDTYRKQWRQLSFLYYLRNPEHAPSDKDWINKVPGFNLNPLVWLATNPQYAVDWEIDPFIQLLDKGALVGEGLIDFIFLKIRQTTPEGAAINSTRIRKLLEHPERLPKPLTVEQIDLLKAHSGL